MKPEELKKIKYILKDYQFDNIPLEVALQDLTKLRFCPAILNDDDGCWATLA